MQVLSSCFLFKGLSDTQLNQIYILAKESLIPKGQFLMHEGQAAENLFILKDGTVELLVNVENGFELPIDILRDPGDITGMSCLLEPFSYSVSSRCVKESKVLIIEQKDFRNLMQTDHDIGCVVMKNLAEHLLLRLKETREEIKIHFRTLFKSVNP